MATIRFGVSRSSPWRCLVWILVAWMGGLAAAPVPAEAAPVPTALALAAPDRAAGLTAIQGFLERKLVRQRLADLGLSAEEIQGRLPQMTDEQPMRWPAVSRDCRRAGMGSGSSSVSSSSC
jgi:hypothetical protein